MGKGHGGGRGKVVGRGMGVGGWGGEDAGKKAVIRDCHPIQERGAVSVVGETTAKKQDTQEQFPPRTQHLPLTPPPNPTNQDDRIPAHRKTTETKILENRNCWDFKGTHFIHTNWSFKRPCESLTVMSKFLGKNSKNKKPIDGRSFSSPLGLSQHFFFFFSFRHSLSFFSHSSQPLEPVLGGNRFLHHVKLAAWRSPGAGRSGWKPFLSSPSDRTCMCVFHFKHLVKGYQKKKKKNRDSGSQG